MQKDFDKQQLKKLNALLQNRTTNGSWQQSITWYHSVGSLVSKLCPKNDSANRGALPRLVASLGIQTEKDAKRHVQELYKMRDLAQAYPDVKKLLGFEHIRWGHLRVLSSVKSKAERTRLEKLCESTKLSSEQLSYQVQSQNSGKSSQGGRRYQSRSTAPGTAAIELRVQFKRLQDLLEGWLMDGGLLSLKTTRTDNELSEKKTAIQELVEVCSEHQIVLQQIVGKLTKLTKSNRAAGHSKR